MKRRQHKFPTGELTRDLLSLVRQGLRTKVRAVCQKLLSGGETTSIADARVLRNKSSVACTITIFLLQEPKEADGLLLVSFQDRFEEAPPRSLPQLPPEEESAVVRQLELEVQTTREDLQSTIEELQTSNEEVMSMNEELQSANEELETSKEELQSFNEELNTVNSQLQSKIDELERANNDIRNLLISTQIATVFLDTDLRINRFTPATEQLLHLIEADIGRPIRDFALRFTDRTLLQDAGRVLDTATPVETEVLSEDGRWYLRRILPYRTAAGQLEGVALTFVDITERIQAEAQSRRLAAVLRDSNDAVMLLDFDGRITSWNRGAERLYGYSDTEALQLKFRDLAPENERATQEELIQRIARGEEIGTFDTHQVTKRGRILEVLSTITLVTDERGHPSGIAVTSRDITERNALQRDLLTSITERQRQIGQDLHDSVGQKLTGLGMLAGSLAETLKEHSPPDEKAANRIARGVEEALEQVRKLSKGLLPVVVDAEGLRAALAELAETTHRDSAIECDFESDQPVRIEDNEVATHLYRIAQEAVTNALKHGAPRHISIHLAREGNHIILSVHDDGKGISAAALQAHGIGLKTMQYRAALIGATLFVRPIKKGGTLMTCRLPENRPHG